MVELTRVPLSLDRAYERVRDPAAGAIVLFVGVVRDNNLDHGVLHLEYEGYEAMAELELKKIEAAAFDRFPLQKLYLTHRLGRVEIGEASTILAVSAGHRGEAFDAARFLIDTLKRDVPIWKKEFFSDGSIWLENPESPRG